jgi:hypothetical protein
MMMILNLYPSPGFPSLVNILSSSSIIITMCLFLQLLPFVFKIPTWITCFFYSSFAFSQLLPSPSTISTNRKYYFRISFIFLLCITSICWLNVSPCSLTMSKYFIMQNYRLGACLDKQPICNL